MRKPVRRPSLAVSQPMIMEPAALHIRPRETSFAAVTINSKGGEHGVLVGIIYIGAYRDTKAQQCHAEKHRSPQGSPGRHGRLINLIFGSSCFFILFALQVNRRHAVFGRHIAAEEQCGHAHGYNNNGRQHNAGPSYNRRTQATKQQQALLLPRQRSLRPGPHRAPSTGLRHTMIRSRYSCRRT